MAEKFETNIRQDPREFEAFLNKIRGWKPRHFLEIGSKHGGTWWRISNCLAAGSRTVSVDLPHGDGSFKESEPPLRACYVTLKKRGYDAHLFIGDSTDERIIADVQALGPFDLVFIDANHTEPYVRKDWANYGSMGKIVAFHDINWKEPPNYKKMPIHVPKIWNELKAQFKHEELRYTPGQNGIGMLWRI